MTGTKKLKEPLKESLRLKKYRKIRQNKSPFTF